MNEYCSSFGCGMKLVIGLVNFNIVGTSNNAANPFTQLSCGNNNAPTLWVGYYQDTTLRAGHYISLANILDC